MVMLQRAVWPFQHLSSKRVVGPLGLECAIDALNLVQMETDVSGQPIARAGVTVPYGDTRKAVLDDPKQFRSLVRRALRGGRFRGRRVVTAMPSGTVRMVTLNYSVPHGQSDAGAIAKVMAGRLDGELGEYVLDYLPIRVDHQSEDHLALIAVARREHVVAYLETLRKAGLQVENLEIGPAALRRLISALSPSGQYQNVLAINFGRTTSYLTLLSGSRLLFDQEVRFGESMLLEQIGQSLSMDEKQVCHLVQRHGLDDGLSVGTGTSETMDVAATLREIVKPVFMDLVNEINRALVYAASETRGEPVRQIYLLGSIARWKGANEYLQSLLDLPVQTIPDPLIFFSGGDGESAPSGQVTGPELAVAAGLALRDMALADV
jgi:type IV pilus assembly protein PilM